MNLQVHFAQNIIKKYLKLATMAQNEIWTCWEENLEKIKIFENTIYDLVYMAMRMYMILCLQKKNQNMLRCDKSFFAEF